MKKYLILTVFLMFISCDPLYYVTYIIRNDTKYDSTVYLFDSVYQIKIDTLVIKKYDFDTLLYSRGISILEKAYLWYDSVVFTFSNDTVIKYYPSDTLKNEKSFFREEDWSVEKKRRQTIIYRFTITDEDLK